MNYTLNQLQIFLKITQTQSITKAAEELHLTQPAVSIQLKNFQDQFEIPLTEVVGKAGIASPMQYWRSTLNNGRSAGVIVIVRVAPVAHSPALGVNT